MKILFAHCNMLGQFEFFAPYLASRGWQVDLITRADAGAPLPQGIAVHRYAPPFPDKQATDSLFYSCQYAASNAFGFLAAAQELKARGYEPDVVMAHCGWGIGLCVKDVWPGCVHVAYHEWYYTDRDWAQDGAPETATSTATLVLNRIRNLPIIAEFDGADANWSPNKFQASRFPPDLRRRIEVIHDGVDLAFFSPDKTASVDLPQLRLPAGVPVLTYTTRGAEPTRGFPQFMTTVALLQKRRKDFHTVIVGQDSIAYGEKLPAGDSWHLRMLDQLDLDLNRVHFLTTLPRDTYRRVLQASSVHFYFTEPFVLSWSFAEAMAVGCLIVGSDTKPLREFVTHRENGLLVPMSQPEKIADQVEWVFDHPKQARQIRKRARGYAVKHFDAAQIFASRERRLVELVAKGGRVRPGTGAPEGG
jgi:glycosyltransferase involved in cell wall biosynthesis